jgi:hypothetical protein
MTFNSESSRPAAAEMRVMDSRLDIAPDNWQCRSKIGEGGEATQDTQRRVARLELHGPLVVYVLVVYVSAGHSVRPDWSIPAFAAVKAVHFRSFVRD